ncbi:MAG: UDP-3-O-(3-hydroxymyristoyl)glucosamine N-acyltransferase [Candidatus Auribacterota bacterium]|jgi:UDP-3-O-[3-hydroxymyristoyl] glucosamine N-acyltransferase|nr:UDP-3-O-(3-hydroxymyristoyl)glucosamine N-acyltransferase [Candidatus Auribacterota bacterium]
MQKSLLEIAQLVNGEVDGNSATMICGVSDVKAALEGTIVFAENEAWLDKAEQSPATAVIIPKTLARKNKPVIKVASPKFAFGMLMQMYCPKVEYKPGVHQTAVIGENVVIEDGVSIQPYAVVQDGAKIGKGSVVGAFCFVGSKTVIGHKCMLNPGVVLYPNTVIGNRVILHSGVVVGSDGFGYVPHDGKQIKVPQIGTVLIEDDVEIGANTTVDCATLGKTVIGQGTKIDNQVQIAHNDVIGKNCIICAQVGISGSSTVGNNVILAGQVGLADHVTIDDNVIVGAKAGVAVNKHLKSNKVYLGSPAREIDTFKKSFAIQQRVPKLFDRVEQLENELKELKRQIAESVSADTV